jgi:hypothetical protein
MSARSSVEEHAALLQCLQHELQEIYNLAPAPSVLDFVTTDAGWARQLLGDVPHDIGESVFVHGAGDDLDISVYFNGEVLKRLGPSRNRVPETAVSLDDFCLVLEGISHFLYVIHRAHHARQTTAFEMELQAEVDKFLVLSRWHATARLTTGHIHHCLFSAVSYRSGLDATTAQRYVDANRYAGMYCRFLQRHYAPQPEARAPLHDELYYFYRLPQPEKISHIERRVNRREHAFR